MKAGGGGCLGSHYRQKMLGDDNLNVLLEADVHPPLFDVSTLTWIGSQPNNIISQINRQVDIPYTYAHCSNRLTICVL